jgi:KUP system potassium uptake protein
MIRSIRVAFAPVNPVGKSHGHDRPQGMRKVAALSAGAIGVVFGDIGTSPLYAIQQCFSTDNGLKVEPANVYGIASLVLWALFLVVTVKYVLFIMRADNRGEGGVMALLALVSRATRNGEGMGFVLVLGLFGAALFLGDGMITPAISVLSAVEGINVATPALHRVIVPVTLGILVGLFWLQSHGTAKIGALFAPVMGIWFATIAVLGLSQIVHHPQILFAIYPGYAAAFLLAHGWHAFVVLGAVVLVVTGGEALYADMGHFGRYPIRLAWFGLVLPALVLNYFGQSALLLRDPAAFTNPFYLMVPAWGQLPMVFLATASTVIASQAVISGVFSVTRQAIQLGLAPRMEIRQTSGEERGQIYVPSANWAMLCGIFILVMIFRTSASLAAAYGIAVTGTMAVDTILALVVARRIWGWQLWQCLAVAAMFLSVDSSFLGANLLKIPSGGWFPVGVGLGMFLLMSTWKRGRQILTKRLAEESLPLDVFLRRQKEKPLQTVQGTAIFMTSDPEMVPTALLHNLKHNKIIHERVVFMTVLTEPVPRVPGNDRVQIEGLQQGFYRLIIRYGFSQSADIPKALRLCKTLGLEFDLMQTSFFLGRETLIPSVKAEMAMWREKLFVAMSKNAMSATDFFKIPSNRVVELGTQVQL